MKRAATWVDDDSARLGRLRTALAEKLSARGVELESLVQARDGTVGRGCVDADGSTVLAPSGVTPKEDDPSLAGVALSDEALAMGVLLGRGGMGQVHAARQASLRREVAVKTALEPRDAHARAALLKEAWAGGVLEHPHVVPIHTLARTSDGRVAVVMKRVEGVSWSKLLELAPLAPGAHASTPPAPTTGTSALSPASLARFLGGHALEAHLRVFVRVCHAIAFAHERGIVHLDLKTDNVMVGDLGEVYVLDWGLAAAHATRDDLAWLPSVRAMPLPAGTPSYMAPELAGAEADRLGTRTDVYLLGALLHHVVTGSPRHVAETLPVTLVRAYFDDPPAYDAEVPTELASILTRAMQREPADRFDTVDALREAVEAFLRHREAEHFRTRAEALLSAIDERLASATRASATRSIDVELEALLAEGEVAVAQLRREWSEHPELARLDEALVGARLRHAIREERLEAAEACLAAASSPTEEQKRWVRELAATLEARRAREEALVALERELDYSLGSRERRRIFATLGGFWLVVSLVLGAVHRSSWGPFGYPWLLTEGVVLVVGLAPYAFWKRHVALQTLVNRRLYAGFVAAACSVEVFWAAAWMLGVPSEDAVGLTAFIYAFVFASLGLALDRRLAYGGALFAIGGVAAAFAPSWSFDIVGLAGGAAVAAALLAWKGRSDVSAPGVTAP